MLLAWVIRDSGRVTAPTAGSRSTPCVHRERALLSLGVRSGLAADEIDQVPERDPDVREVETPRGPEDRVLDPHSLVGRPADVGDLQPRRAVRRLALGGIEARVSDPGCRG